MKSIYVSHSTKIDYRNDLYAPLKKIGGAEFIFPHEEQREPKSSKEMIRECSLFIAEVSVPSVSVGIEAGWADASGVPVIFLIKKGENTPLSLGLVSENIIEYDNLETVLPRIKQLIDNIGK